MNLDEVIEKLIELRNQQGSNRFLPVRVTDIHRENTIDIVNIDITQAGMWLYVEILCPDSFPSDCSHCHFV